MSDGLNVVHLLGNLGADPELRMTAGGQAVLTIRLATSESYLDRERNRQERTEWHTVIVWGKRAEALARILHKGSKINVMGSLRTNSWEGNDGSKRYRTEIQAQRILLCGDGRRPPTRDDADDYDRGEAPPSTYNPPGGYTDDDDIPF